MRPDAIDIFDGIPDQCERFVPFPYPDQSLREWAYEVFDRLPDLIKRATFFRRDVLYFHSEYLKEYSGQPAHALRLAARESGCSEFVIATWIHAVRGVPEQDHILFLVPRRSFRWVTRE